MPRVIHRSQGLNSSHVEKSARFTLPMMGLPCACAVKGGTLPLGGSTTREVCVDLTPRCSFQCSGLLMLVRLFCSERLRSCAFNSATSASVKRALPASSGGRSNGVAVLFVHTPCRSGSPHGVRMTRELRAAASCAATGICVSINGTTGHDMTRAAIELTNRTLIGPPLQGTWPSALRTSPARPAWRTGPGKAAAAAATRRP